MVIAVTDTTRGVRWEDAEMVDETLERARAGDGEAFAALTEPYRRELLVHCYRLLGSVHDAEDTLQDVLTAAWRGLAGFESRSSIRTWLYRIATNRALNAIRSRARHPRDRPLPHLPGNRPEPTRIGEALWLDPYPDSLLSGLPDDAPGPDAQIGQREAVGLAFVTATQLLPPRQRAALVLRDVLGFAATEVASMLDTTEDSVTSALKRARATIAARRQTLAADDAPLPGSPRERQIVSRFTTAFENGDVGGIVALLTDDAWLTMPPLPLEYQGPLPIGEFMATISFRAGRRRYRTTPVRANGQPALACWSVDPGEPAVAHGIVVLTLSGDRIAAITRFPASSFGYFGVSENFGVSQNRAG
jgi:RNA polymerase sigma-70 factor (ECF subfamily)